MPEITDTDVLELFVGTRYTSDSMRHSIKQSDFEAIKAAIVPRSSSIADYLLLLLWIREIKFGMPPQSRADVIIFIQNACTLGGVEVGDEIEWKTLDRLVQEGSLQETIADRRTKVYSLTLKGKKTAERIGAEKDISARVESPPIVLETNFADYPIMTQAASGKGIPKSAVVAHQESIEWTEEPANVNINKIAPAEREALGESIGRNAAKWLLKSDMAKTNKELQEAVLSDMGFKPIEVTDMLYPDNEERRNISKRISKNKNKPK